jgi:hypothetical protein
MAREDASQKQALLVVNLRKMSSSSKSRKMKRELELAPLKDDRHPKTI